jgi:CheY-like chemotaxis protein
MSHELRTPLAGMLGTARILLQTELTEEQEDCTKDIIAAGETLDALVSNILDLSKITHKKIVLERRCYCLIAAVENCIKMMAQTDEVEFLYSIASDVPKNVLGDETRLQQILLNLLSNAAKFTHHGFIRLDIRMATSLIAIEFQVSDSGIGISQDACSSLFQPFMQADTSTTRKYGGTGLGLNIASQLALMIGSGISVSSAEGTGSVFSFTADLPTATVDADLESQKAMRSGAVLVIAHTIEATETYVSQLKQHFNVVCGELTLEAALEQTAKDPRLTCCQALIVDSKVDMQTLPQLRLRAGPNAQLILIGGASCAFKELQVKVAPWLCIDIEEVTYMRKPVLFSQLLSRLNQTGTCTRPGDNISASSTTEDTSTCLPTVKLNNDKCSTMKKVRLPKNARTLRVLVAEDAVVMMKVMCRMLRNVDLSPSCIFQATNGQEAVDAVVNSANNFDVIFMDMHSKCT